MNAKLTLTLDKALIEDTKKYAKSVGKNPSAVIGEFLETLGQNNGRDIATEEVATTVSLLRGAFTETSGYKPKKGGRKPAVKTSK